jgi:nicotinate (nicotinamide) nucleotide adenylyltransferase
MDFYRRAPGTPRFLAILAGTFNPPTTAHLALANAALALADEVLFALPRVFPHKSFDGATFEQRIAMLLAATGSEPRFSVASPSGGLFIDVARECRDAYSHGPELAFLCGADAAQRIVEWDYGHNGSFLDMLTHFELWVADRPHSYDPPEGMRSRIRRFPFGTEWQEVSATEVRQRVERGQPWENLVPEVIRGMVREIYS